MRVKVLLFGSPGYGSFNQCGVAGVEIARRAGRQVELIWIESTGPAIRAARVIDVCHHGADLVVAYGSAGDYPVAMAAERFPHIHFVVIQGSHLAENCAVYGVKQEQSAFLAGVAAAAESRTGGLGHLSAVKTEAALWARAAYVDGAMRQSPGMGMMTSFCGSQDDEGLAFETCEAMAKRGVDVVFAAVDGGRPGAVLACQKFRLRQIGAIVDWTETDPKLFVGSAISDTGRCIAAAIQDHAEGNLPFGTRTDYGVERPEYVRLALSPLAGASTRQAVEEWSQALVRGEVVPSREYSGREFDLSGLLSRI